MKCLCKTWHTRNFSARAVKLQLFKKCPALMCCGNDVGQKLLETTVHVGRVSNKQLILSGTYSLDCIVFIINFQIKIV